MLKCAKAGYGARLSVLVLHDVAKREYTYGSAQGLPDTKVGTFTQALYDEAKDKIAGGKELGAGVDLDKADVQAYSDICICYFWWRGVLYYRYQYCWQDCP